MTACPYAEDGAEYCSEGLSLTLHIREVCSLPASVNLIDAVCRNRLLQLETWSDCRMISTPLYRSSWSVSHIRSQYGSDLSAGVNVTCLACGYYTFKFPSSTHRPGTLTGLMGQPLTTKFPVGCNHIQCLIQNLRSILAVFTRIGMCIRWRTVDSLSMSNVFA